MASWRKSLVIFVPLCFTASPARAQDYPNRPVTLIAPIPPGGSTTIGGRIIAEKMGNVLGQSLVERLSAALKSALATEDVKQKLAIEGADPPASTPEGYAADIDAKKSQ